MRQQITDFKCEVDRLDRELETLIEECSIRKMFPNYNKAVRAYAEKADQCQRLMVHINTQEEHLGWAPTVFAEVEKILTTLRPN